jgi:sec-independent protein translocase protein TatA
MGALSPTHWLIIIGVVVVLFGAKKLPEAARGLGRSSRILKAELHGLHDNPAPAATGNPHVEAEPGIPPADTAQHDSAVASAARDDAASSNAGEPAASPPRQR